MELGKREGFQEFCVRKLSYLETNCGGRAAVRRSACSPESCLGKVIGGFYGVRAASDTNH